MPGTPERRSDDDPCADGSCVLVRAPFGGGAYICVVSYTHASERLVGLQRETRKAMTISNGFTIFGKKNSASY